MGNREMSNRDIDLKDYRHNAADRGWGPGWPSPAAGHDVVGVSADRSGAKFVVRRAIAVLVDMLVDWTESPRGGDYVLHPEQCGSYNNRPIGGTQVASNHSWGLAVDLNWNANRLNSKGERTIPDSVAQTWKKYGFAWGGDYGGPAKDWMHFEFMGTPADAAEQTRAALRDLSPTTPPPVGPLRRGSVGRGVMALQTRLNSEHPEFSHLSVDGEYGANTEAAVREFQRSCGLVDDGVAGANTLHALGIGA